MGRMGYYADCPRDVDGVSVDGESVCGRRSGPVTRGSTVTILTNGDGNGNGGMDGGELERLWSEFGYLGDRVVV